MRNTSVNPPPAWPVPGSHQRFVELDLRALTPIFKGGSTTAQVDEGRPFRAPSIRGVLRYWWRATSTLADVEQLRAREEELFGGVHSKGPVASAVSVAILGQQSTLGPRPSNKPYAFGVTGKVDGDVLNRQVHASATGRLRVEWRDDGAEDEVKRALKAWLLFGGVGGRSRRGAGSVWWNEGLDRPMTIEQYIADWRGLVPEGTTKLWPTLAGSVLLVGPAKDSADAAWAEGLDGVRDVRASVDVRPGFVQTRGADLLEWKRQDYIPISGCQLFTSRRAALGLPIRFNSRGNGFRGSMGPQGHNRYPSPLHLKVVQMGRQFQPVILAVRGPAPKELMANHTNGKLDTAGLDRFLELAAQLPSWERHV